MTEWQVVLVIIAIAGLITGIGAPVIRLNTSITRMTVTMEKLVTDINRIVRDMESSENRNTAGHERLWEHNGKQDDRISDHESRITLLEN